MRSVSYRRIATAIKMASKVGTCCIVVSFAVTSGRQGNTERVFAQLRCPVASGEAMVMLHQAMRSIWHRRTAMAIEMASDGGAFVRPRRLFQLL